MTDERLQILQMVQEGKISPEEAGKLLDALEQPQPRTAGRPSHIRIQVTEGSKITKFSVGVKLVKWVLGLPFLLHVGADGQSLDKDALLEAIAGGRVGKVFEASEGRQHIEIWLDE